MFLQRLKIAERILLLVVLPITCMIGFLALELKIDLNDYNRAKTGQGFVDYTKVSADFVHNIQKERGASAGYLSSKGNAEQKTLLQKMRAETDQALNAFNQVTGNLDASENYKVLTSSLKDTKNQIAQLSEHRKKVDNFDILSSDNVKYYSTIIEQIVATTDKLIFYIDGAKLGQKIYELRSVMLAKETSGQGRATGMAIISSGRIDPDMYKTYVEITGRQNVYLKDFMSFGSASSKKAYEDILNDQNVRNAAELNTRLLNIVKTNNLEGLSTSDWWNSTTARINRLKDLENNVLNNLSQEINNVVKASSSQLWLMVAIEALIIIVVGIISFVVGRSISRPIKQASQTLDKISNGEEGVHIPAMMPSRSEIGRISNTIADFIKVAEERAQLEEDKIKIERDADNKRRTALVKMASEVEAATIVGLNTILECVEDLRHRSDMMRTSLDRASGASRDAADKAEMSRSLNEEANDLAHQMSGAIQEIAQQVDRGNKITQGAVTRAQNSKSTIDALSKSASEIQSILEVVSQIAEQTNLLALNATIEAARAGDAGRGFAVVAGEVKALADQTSKFTDQISSRVAEIRSATTASVTSIEDIGHSINELSEVVTLIAAAIEEQSAASQGMSSAMNQAKDAVSSVTGSAEEIAEMVTQIHRDAEALGGIADKIVEAPQTMKDEVPSIIKDAMNKADRRKDARIEVAGQVTLECKGRQTQAIIVNLSSKGARLDKITGFKVGDKGILMVPNGQDHKVKVIWTYQDSIGVELEASTFSKAEITMLTNMVNRKAA